MFAEWNAWAGRRHGHCGRSQWGWFQTFPPKCVRSSKKSQNQSGHWPVLPRPPSEGFRCGSALWMHSGLTAWCHRPQGRRVSGQVARGLLCTRIVPGVCTGAGHIGTGGGGCKWLCLNSDSSVQHGVQVQTGWRVLSLMSQHQLGECHVLGPGPAFLEPPRGLEYEELGDTASG